MFAIARTVVLSILIAACLTAWQWVAAPSYAKAWTFSDCLNFSQTLGAWDFESDGYAKPDVIDSSSGAFARAWMSSDGTWNVPRSAIMGNDKVTVLGTSGAPISDAADVRLFEGPTGAAAFTLSGDGSFTYRPRPTTVEDSFSYWWYLTGYCSNVTTVTIRNGMAQLRDDVYAVDKVPASGSSIDVSQTLPPRVPFDTREVCGGLSVCGVFANDERLFPLNPTSWTAYGNDALTSEWYRVLPSPAGYQKIIPDETDPATTVNGGKIIVRSDGTVVYTPATGFVGQDVVYYAVQQASKKRAPGTNEWLSWGRAYGTTSGVFEPGRDVPETDFMQGLAKVTFDVRPRDQRALVDAVGDGLTVTEDSPLVITPAMLLANDQSASQVRSVQRIDPSSTFTARPNSVRTAHGTIAIAWNLSAASAGQFSINQLTYTPDPNYFGPDSFEYEARGIFTDPTVIPTDWATVSINVAPVADDPVARQDNGSTNTATPLTVNVTLNDSDADGDLNPSSAQAITLGEGWTQNPDKTFTLTPAKNRYGLGGFSYRVADGRGVYASSSVLVRIMPIVPDSYSTDEDTPLVVGGLGVRTNDAPPAGGEPVTVWLGQGTGHGVLALASTGGFTYTPDPNFAGTDTFTYRVTGGGSNYSNPGEFATVTITVRSVPDAPRVVLNADCGVVGPDVACSDPADDRSIIEGQTVRLRAYVTDGDANFSGNLTVDWGDGSTTQTFRYPCTATVFFGFCLQEFWFTPTWSTGTASPDRMYVDLAHTYPTDPADSPDTYQITVRASDLGATGAAVTATARVANRPPTLDVATSCAAGATGGVCIGRTSYLTVPDGSPVKVEARVEDAGNDPVAVRVDWGDGTTSSIDMTCGTAPCADAAIHAVNNCALGSIQSFGFVPKTICGDLSLSHAYSRNGTYRVAIDVDDGDGGVLPTRFLTVISGNPNAAPIAGDDAYAATEDQTLPADASRNLLGNDTDPDGTALVASLVAQGGKGTATVNANGTFAYVPKPNAFGTDTFSYRACDPQAVCDAALVTITIAPVNDMPIAWRYPAGVSIDEGDFTITTNVVVTSADVDGDPLTPTLVTPPTAAATKSFSLAPNGDLNWTFDPDFNGTASFVYRICDPSDACDEATVLILVTPVNDAPVARNATVDGEEDVTSFRLPPGVAEYVTDADDDPITISLVTAPDPAAVTLFGPFADGSWGYTPAPDKADDFSFVYQACDPSGACDTGTVWVLLDPVPDQPMVGDDYYDVTEDEEIHATTSVLANDSDADGPALEAVLVSQPLLGSVNLLPDGTFYYTSPGNYNGSDSFIYKACDPTGRCSGATVHLTVTPVNDAPLVLPDNEAFLELFEDRTDAITTPPGLLDIAGDVEGDPMTIELIDDERLDPLGGSFVLSPDGTWRFNPTPNLFGTFPVGVRVCDSFDACSTTTVELRIAGSPDAPTARDDNYELSEDFALWTIPYFYTASPTANDSDPDGDTLVASLLTQPSHGRLDLFEEDGSFLYYPDADYAGQDTFTYKVCDPTNRCDDATVTITINAVNDAPRFDADPHVDVTEGDFTDIPAPGLLDFATDPEGDPMTITATPLTDTSNQGQLFVDPDGAWRWEPAYADFYGTLQYRLEACDDSDACASTTFELRVAGTPDAPYGALDSGTTEDTPFVIDFTDQVDVDGDPITPTGLDYAPSHGTIAIDGKVVTYTPDPNVFGFDLFNITICDDTELCGTYAVYLDIYAVNDRPTATPDTADATEDTQLDVPAPGVLDNDSDVEGSSLTAVLVSGPSHAKAFTLRSDGSYTYTPDADYAGTDAFDYEACESPTFCTQTAATITVTNVNDAPAATGASVATDEDTALDIPLAHYGTDPDSDVLTGSVHGGPSHGSINVTDGVARYTPDANYNGPDSFPYTVCDPSGLCADGTVDVTVRPVNDRPVADADAYSVVGGTVLNVPAPGVLDGDTDVEGSPLTAAAAAGPAHGVVRVNADGSFIYTPDAGYVGSDSFTYRASDGLLQSRSALVTITVTDPNVAPVAANDSYSTNEDTTLTVSAANGVLKNDSDANNDPLTAILVSGPSNGTLSLNSNGSFTYSPSANFNGSDSFTYKANDGSLDSATKTVTITVDAVNDAPTIAITGGSCTSDSLPAGTVTYRVADIDSTSLTVTAANARSAILPAGSLSVDNAGRTVTINATATKNGGSAVVTLTVTDGSATGTTTVNVIVGTSKGENLTGTAGTDLVFGLSGIDTLTGAGAIDILCGGQGDDVLRGGDGDDVLNGLSGADTLEGNAGNDSLLGGGGNDILRGGDGNDTLRGQGGADAFTGGADVDTYADLTLADGDSQTEAP